MPRDPYLPLTREEQRFVVHYLREGAVPEHVHIAERKARMKAGEGKTMLRRKHVQEEIHRRKILVEYEENRLIAKDSIGLAQQADERDRVTLDKIESALDKVISLDAKEHGSTVLEAIRLGLVYTGTIRDGRRERVVPADPTKSENGGEGAGQGSFYSSIFNDVRTGDAVGPSDVAPAPLMPEDNKPKPPPTIPVVRPAATPPATKPAAAKPAPKKPTPEIEMT